MQNNNSLKYLHIINKTYKGRYRLQTPLKGEYPSIKDRLLDSRKVSPESRLKLKSTMAMYKSIKRSLTPVKPLKLEAHESLKVLHKSKILPDLAGEITKISVKEYGIGNDYARALSSTVRQLPNLKELNIRSNRVTDEGIFSLLSSLNKSNMKNLDLSCNILGMSSINSVVEIISDFNSAIEKLSLESTRLNYPYLVKIFSGLRTNHTIQELNLANNKLGIGTGYHLKEFLSQTTTLKKLDLHWNLIQGYEAVLLFQGIKENDTLTSVDISWNSIGSSDEAVDALCACLAVESQLQHLDLSNNRISFSSAEKIGKALVDNHTLLGLHLEGNHCRVDHLGFVIASQTLSISPSLQKSARILRTPRRVNEHNCWVCSRYLDLALVWDPASILWKKSLKSAFNSKITKKKELIYVHLDIDNYEPYSMKLDEASNCFQVNRAVPFNKQVKFFFSYRGHSQVSFDYPTESLPEPFTKCINSEEIIVKALNYFTVYEGELTCKPRMPSKPFLLESGEDSSIVISEWSFEKSHFANYVWDNEETLNSCFEFDWSNSKMLRLIKNEKIRNQVKEAVRPFYKQVKKVYKYYAALGTNGNIFSINLALLTEFCSKTEILDKSFKISDIDLSLKASKFSLSNVNTSYGLVRHEFLEFLIRVALDKYFRSGVCKTEAEAILMFFSNHFGKITVYDQDKWRWDRFFNQECEEVIMENRDIFQSVFDLNSGKKAKPGERKFMQVEDFLNICQNHELMNETFNIRQATFCFHMALMTHVDELNGILHTQANRLEFIEALARVADFLDSVDPEREMINNVYSDVPLDSKVEIVVNRSFLKYRDMKKTAKGKS